MCSQVAGVLTRLRTVDQTGDGRLRPRTSHSTETHKMRRTGIYVDATCPETQDESTLHAQRARQEETPIQ
jgi:hypothetical protein